MNHQPNAYVRKLEKENRVLRFTTNKIVSGLKATANMLAAKNCTTIQSCVDELEFYLREILDNK
jgi:hypothetical protein